MTLKEDLEGRKLEWAVYNAIALGWLSGWEERVWKVSLPERAVTFGKSS